jgi:hypothetical protein
LSLKDYAIGTNRASSQPSDRNNLQPSTSGNSATRLSPTCRS